MKAEMLQSGAGVKRQSLVAATPAYKTLGREQLISRLAMMAGANHLPAGMAALADYVGASHYLLARYDLIQEQGLDFVVSSNWPFDLVRRLSSDLANRPFHRTRKMPCRPAAQFRAAARRYRPAARHEPAILLADVQCRALAAFAPLPLR